MADWLRSLPLACNVLRAYQRSMLDQIADRLEAGSRRVLAQAPTGAGKTHVIASIALAAWAANLHVLILATRTRLIRQLHERLDEFAVDHGVIAAPLPQWRNAMLPVQIASVDTLYRRCVVDERMPLPFADIVIFDEAHLSLGASRRRLLEQFPRALLAGFTATPAKTSGRSLGAMFDDLVLGPKVQDLIDQGALVRSRIFAAPSITEQELKVVRTSSSSGDYAAGDLSAAMSRPRIVGDVVQSWLKFAAGKRTLVFACDKAHGQHLVERFLQEGVAAELLTDDDTDAARELAIGRLESGATRVLVNCFLLSYGIDVPTVECISLARPTRSVALYLQAVGRGMRPAPGKDSLLVLDHGRVVESLGLPTDDFAWSLESEDNVNARAALATRRKSSAERPRTCQECACMWSIREQGPACPECGWQPVPFARGVVVEAGELEEVAAAGSIEGESDSEALEQFCCEALGWYARRWPTRWNDKPNSARWWAWSHAVRRFSLPLGPRNGLPPMPRTFWRLQPIDPSDSVAGWLKSQLIAYAKSQELQRYASH